MIESGKNYSAQQISNWSRADIGQFKEAAASKDGFIIKGKNFKYKVTVENGNSRVEVAKSPWWSTKRTDRNASTKAQNLAKALNIRKQTFDKVDSNLRAGNTNKTEAVTNNFKELLKGVPDPEVAIYGKGSRQHMKTLMNSAGLKPVTIDEYNKSVGIAWEQASSDNVPTLLKNLSEQNLSKNLPKTDEPVSDTRRGEWAKYLEKNVDRLDVMAKCKRLAQQDGSGKALARFILKNCPPEKIEKGLSQKLRSAGSTQERLQLIKDTELFQELSNAAKDDNYKLKLSSGSAGLDFMLQTAFFRTTSKMGLEFFASQSIPVAFWTAELGYESELGAVNTDSLKLKPWMGLENRVDSTDQSRSEAITYSELRYVEKLKSHLSDQVEKTRSEGMAQFSPNNVQVFPILVHQNTGGIYMDLHNNNTPFSPETPQIVEQKIINHEGGNFDITRLENLIDELAEEVPHDNSIGEKKGQEKQQVDFGGLEHLLDPNDEEVQRLVNNGLLDPSKLTAN